MDAAAYMIGNAVIGFTILAAGWWAVIAALHFLGWVVGDKRPWVKTRPRLDD